MEQVIKVTERIDDSLIRQVVNIDESQFGFVPVTTDAVCHPPAAGETSHGKQTYLYGFCGPREGVRLSFSESDLVGNEKAWCS